MNIIIGSSIKRIQEVGSTNNYAAEQLLTNRPQEGTVFVANSQVDGRGQTSNKWESEPYKNLTFSIVLYPDILEIAQQFEISKAVSLGITDFLNGKVQQVSIKWPNDIYVGTRKIGGILIENSVRINKISSCIVGIGLNINQKIFITDAPNPVSLTQITKLDYDLETILIELCDKIDRRYQQLISLKFNSIDDDYIAMLYQSDQWAIYKDAGGTFTGRIIGVDRYGRLRIESEAGSIRKYQFKEVEFEINTETL